MNKKVTAFLAVLIILIFIGYMIFDTVRQVGGASEENLPGEVSTIPDAWVISKELKVKEGSLKAVTVSPAGDIYLGGDAFVAGYDKDMKLKWKIDTSSPVTSLSIYGDTVFASTVELILILNTEGEIKGEWGPYEDKAIITSVSSNKKNVVFADAGNKALFILDKGGEVRKMVGLNDSQFIVPSPYFDVALNEDNLFVANTGHRRVEKRTAEGGIISYFGEPGTAPEAFCGCCNPAHFVLIPDGFVTAEKGINRIKILGHSGEFIEFVSAKNKFAPAIPLDLASADGKTIYAANPNDSKLYVFTRK